MLFIDKAYTVPAITIVLIIVNRLDLTQSVIPSVCAQNVSFTGSSGVCCPFPAGSRHRCGGRGRGSCQQMHIQRDEMNPANAIDDRMNWPSRLFQYACQCEGNHFGVACDECWYGWEGPLCSVKTKHIRRNVLSFTPQERSQFVNVVAQMPKVELPYFALFEDDPAKTDPTREPKFIPVTLQYYIAFVHEYASRSTMFDSQTCPAHDKINNAHGVVGFPTWHRYLMLVWERELRKIAIELYDWHDFAIPYWDWVDAKHCEVCVNDLVGAPGPIRDGKQYLDPKSPFSKWTEYCTPPTGNHDDCIGCHSAWPNFDRLNRWFTTFNFPTTQDLEFALGRVNYYLPMKHEDSELCRGFHEAFEGNCGLEGSGSRMRMHNQVHNNVHGSFCCSPTASNDPIFILHHSQLDRIMQVWFEYYLPRSTEFPNHGTGPGNCRECNLIGFIPTVKHAQMFVDMHDLGIYYDNYAFGNQGYRGELFIKRGPTYTVDR